MRERGHAETGKIWQNEKKIDEISSHKFSLRMLFWNFWTSFLMKK